MVTRCWLAVLQRRSTIYIYANVIMLLKQVLGDYGMDPWGFSHGLGDDQVNLDASWIWSENPALFVLCRIVLAGQSYSLEWLRTHMIED